MSGLGCLIGTLWPSLLIAIVVPGLRCGGFEVWGVVEAGVIVGGGGGGGISCDVRLEPPRDGGCGLCGKKLISGAIEVLCVTATSLHVLVPVRPRGNDAHAAFVTNLHLLIVRRGFVLLFQPVVCVFVCIRVFQTGFEVACVPHETVSQARRRHGVKSHTDPRHVIRG